MQPSTPLVTTASRSTSSNIILGDFPPSSNATRFTVSAADLEINEPARVDPVKETISISG